MYKKMLAEIHHHHFDSISKSCAEHVRRHLMNSEKKIDLLDLGCGSGVLLKELSSYSNRMVGIDVSTQMLNICRNNVLNAELIEGDILKVALPHAHCIVMVGEVLSYAAAEIGNEDVKNALLKFFSKVHNALAPEGLFIFDVVSDNYDFSGNFCHDTDEFTIFMKASIDGNLLTREIISFSSSTVDNYRKSIETHNLRVFSEELIRETLITAGFEVKQLVCYSDKPLLSGRVGFECRKNKHIGCPDFFEGE